MKIKRYLSIILCVLLALPLGISPVFAGESAGEFVINELGNAVGGTSLDTEITLDGSPTAKWLTKGSGSQVVYNINDDISEYDTLNVQLYSPKVTDDTIGLHIYTTNGYATRIILVDWEGWKTIQVPMSTYAKANLKEATTFQLWDHGWSYTYGDAISGSDKNGSMNIGRIWLSVTGEYVIRDDDITPSRGTNCSVDREFTYEGEATLKWLTKGNNDSQVVYNLAGDFTGYQTLNMQIYSPKSTNNTIGIHFHTAKAYSAKALAINWEGWKTVQIPMSDFSSINLSEAESFQMWDHGWSYNYGDAIAGSDKNGSLHIAKIWLDNSEIQKPSEPDAPDVPDIPDVPDDETEYVIREDIITPSRGSTCSLDNSLKYDGLTTLKWTTNGNESQIVYNIAGDVSGYQTFNMQLYSPKATNDTIGIHFHSSKGYATKTLTVDWEGWKTIQIPMSDFASITLADVSTFQMWDHGWRYTYGDAMTGSDKNGSLNIGKIWLDNSEIPEPDKPDAPVIPDVPDEPQEPDETLSGEYDIAKYDSSYAFSGKLSKDTQNVYTLDASAKWDVRSGNNFSYNVGDCDFGEYKYVYATIYSPKATESVIMLQYLFEGTGYATTSINLDFEGWKTLCFPIDKTGIGTNKVAKVYVYNNGWSNKIEGIEYINLERIWLSKYDINACELVYSTLVSGYDRVSPKDFGFILTFASKLDSEVAPVAYLEDLAGAKTILETKVTGSKLEVIASDVLDYNKNYKVKITGITDIRGNLCEYADSFKTNILAISASDVQITQKSEGEFVANASVINPLSALGDAVIYIGEFTPDGEAVNVFYKTVSIEAGSEAEIDVEISGVSPGNTVEAFVADSIGRPICPRVAVYGSDDSEIQKSIGGSFEISLDKAFVTAKGIKADVVLKSDFAYPVAAIVKNGNGEVIYARAVMNNSEGKAHFDAKFPDEKIVSGKYTLAVSAEKASEVITYDFYFASPGDKAAVYAEIGDAKGVKDIETIVKNEYSIFGLSEKSVSENKTAQFIAEMIYADKSAVDFDSLKIITDKALDLRDEINTCDWNKVSNIIEENYLLLLCGDLMEDYSKLNSDEKAKVSKKLKENAPYELFSDFASDLEDFIDDVNSGDDKKQSSGGGGGGGGGSAYSVPLGGAATNAVPEAATPSIPFNDLASASWAKDSIVALYNLGVVSASSNGKFRPDDSITREEFSKLICLAFGFEDKSAVCNFADVSSDAWYYSYVASLCAKGIITGYGGNFGSGDLITREDMAVMAMRALNAKSESLDSSSGAFFDDSEISDYAKSAVYALKNAGIINGMGDGNFAPKANSTRAQAAKIICGLMAQLN